MSRILTLDDIADARAYERGRPEFLQHVIELKRRRRVGVGPIVTMVFENRATIRFQIQEMARAEKLYSDDAIRAELATYNPLVPAVNSLSATLFLELTTKEQLMEWLPKLVGIEQAVELRLPGGAVVHCEVDAAHAEQLTRDDVTASVHYVGFRLSDDEVAAFAEGPVAVVVAHPNYHESTIVNDETRAELLADLCG